MRPEPPDAPSTTAVQVSSPETLDPAPTAESDSEFPPPDTARAREAAAAADATANGLETRAERARRQARRTRLYGYALAVTGLVAVLIALAATNTALVHVNWLFGSGRVALVWLVLGAAAIGAALGVLVNARVKWLTRSPRPARRKPLRPGSLFNRKGSS
jgi:uncharacterized integral membrane protein